MSLESADKIPTQKVDLLVTALKNLSIGRGIFQERLGL